MASLRTATSRLKPAGGLAGWPVLSSTVPKPQLGLAVRAFASSQSTARPSSSALLASSSSSAAHAKQRWSPASRRNFSSSPAMAWSANPLNWVPSRSTAAPARPSEFAPEPVEAAATPSEPFVASTPTLAESVPPSTDSIVDSIASTVSPLGTLDLSAVSSWGLHPVVRLQSLFVHLHDSFPILAPLEGLEWWALIPLVTLVTRVILLPFQLRSVGNMARMAKINPEMMANMNKMKEAKAKGDMQSAMLAQQATMNLMRTHNVNPIKNVIFPLAQGAVFMTMFFALRGIATSGVRGVETEGLAWFTNLGVSDPYYALPVLSAGLTLAAFEYAVKTGAQAPTSNTAAMKYFFRGLLVFSIPFIAYFPAMVLWYWVANNSLSIVQAYLVKQTFLRKLFNIPDVPPRPQKGEPGYEPEPSFMEAFRNMQTSLKDKAVEAAEKTKEREAQQKARKAMEAQRQRATAKAAPVAAAPAATAQEALLQKTTVHRSTPPTAKGGAAAAFESEKQARIRAAREKRYGVAPPAAAET